MATPFPTRINKIAFTHFRNYPTLSLSFEPKIVVLTGPNGSGKTNLLEALSFLSPGRGLRRANYADIGLAHEKGGNGSWAVHAEVETAYGAVDIGTGLTFSDGLIDKTRKIHIDKEPVKTADSLSEHLRVLWLTPSMDGIFTGPAGDRRRFLDRLVLAVDPSHGQRVNAFEKALRNRNKILEEAFDNQAWLDAAEVQVAELAVAITAARIETLQFLEAKIDDDALAAVPFPKAHLSLEGALEQWMRDDTATEVEDRFRLHLKSHRHRDRLAKRTLDGPHRADLIVRHADKNMPARLCSTGEQKALLIRIILAHARLVAGLSNMIPILLLDEIAAHLDHDRRAALFEFLDKLMCQAFMTGTDDSLFSLLGPRAQGFHVENANITAW